MNKATLYNTQIFAYIGYLVCAEHTYEEENKEKIREENTGTGYLNNPKQIHKRKFAAFKEFSLSDKTIIVMPKKVKGASLATEDKLRCFDFNFKKFSPKDTLNKKNVSSEESATKIKIETYSCELQKKSQTIQKLENRLTHTNKKMTDKEARSEVTYKNNVNLLKKADAIEKSVSGNSYFGQIFAEAELISRRCTDDKSKFCSRGFMDFEMTRNFAGNVEIFNCSAFSEQSVFKQWRRQSNFNVVAYNMSIASQLDASAREILMPAYSSKCFQCIYYNKSFIVKYLSTHIKPKAPKNCNNTPLSSAQNLLLLRLDGTMDAMDLNASAANTESTEHKKYIHDYIRFLRCIIYGKESERQGNFNPAIKLLLSYMIEFVFWIEERIRLLSMQKIFGEHDIKHITEEYNFLKAVIYRYQVLCGLKIIQMQSKECRAKLAEAEWSFTVEMYTNENNLIALNNTDNLRIAEKDLKQDIMTLRTHIQDSIKNQASNQYIFYSEAMRIFYYPRYIEKVTRMCGFIYFILAFTQKCGIAIANMMGKYPKKRKNTCIQRLMHDSAEFRENIVLTLQLVCEYFSHGKCDYNDIALVYPDGIRAYVYSIDPMNPKTIRFEEITNVFSYLYEKIRYIIPE